MGHDGNKPNDANKPSDHQGDKHDKPENAEKNARKARGEASNELESGSLNDTTKATRQKQFESGKSGITDYKFPPAKGVFGDAVYAPLTKEAEHKRDADFKKHGWGDSNDLQGAKAENPALEQRLHDRAANHHRDIAGQIKEGFKNGTAADHQGEGAKHVIPVSDKGGKSKIEHHDPTAIEGLQNTVRTDVNTAWNPVEKAVNAANDIQQGHLKDSDGWRDVDVNASSVAFKSFPKLGEYNLPSTVIAGLILNEVRHRDAKDGTEDLSVKMFGTVRNINGSENDGASIGPGQVQIRTIRDLASKYPQLQQFDNPVKAALEPDKAPMFVAAYVSEKIQALEAHNKQQPENKVDINLKSVLYSYNPDVLARDGVTKPSANDYRAITPAEKVENSITKHRPTTEQGWHSVWFATNSLVTDKSEVVKNMLDGIKAIEHHKLVSKTIQSQHKPDNSKTDAPGNSSF